MIIVHHHLNNSRSQRVLWLLEEMGRKSPVILDGTVRVAESGAIIDYLVDRYGGGRLISLAGTTERPRYTYRIHACDAYQRALNRGGPYSF
jgi:glutathione S-transferase